jgi:hypothetical protein
MKHARYPNFSALALVLGTIALVGCGGMATVSNSTSTDTPPPAGAPAAQVVAGPAIKGSVFGGHAPLQGAHVYLVQPGITGYGSAATSLLGTGTTTSPDGFTLMSNPSGMTKDPNVPVGAMFEVSDSGGNFNFTGAYSCTVGMPVYIYAWGGAISSTAVNNESIVQLATLGNCPSSGNFSTAGNGALQFVYLNEVSTIATAYTFQPFTLVGNNSAWDIGIPNPATHPQALTGIQNAAATAAQLYDIQGATQLSTGPGEPDGEGHIANFQTVGNGSPNSGNGVVPQATIDSLANIVANCVDSAPATLGAQTAQCSGLFAIATNNGEIGTAANEPVDTGTAAINIARFPAGNSSDGAANVDAHYASHIFNLPSGTVPYQPDLTVAPNDWTLAINYPGLTPVVGSANKAGVTNNTLNLAESLAIDNSGQVWITSQGEPNGTGGFTIMPDIVRWSNLGAENTINTFPYIPGYVSVDGSGNAWTGNANCSPTNTVCATGTPILFATSNGQLDTNVGSGYFNAYVVVANSAGDAFFFASNSTLTPDYGMWEYDASQNLVAGAPFNCCGTSTTTTTPTAGTFTITSATVTTATHGGVTTFTYNFKGNNQATNPLVPGPVTLAGLGNKTTNPNKGDNWASLDGPQTVTAANGTTFTVTGTKNLNISGDEAGGTADYTNNVTTTTTTTGAIPSGDNVAHGAIDADGDLWITAETPGNTIARVSPTGVSQFTPITLPNTNNTANENQPEFPAIDNSGNAWIALQETASQILKVSPSGATTVLAAEPATKETPVIGTTSTVTGALMTSTFGAAVDGNGNVWFANRAGNYGAVNTGTGAAVAGENTIFVLNGGAGTPGIENTAISPTTNYVPEAQYPATPTDKFTPLLNGSLNLAIDPSGNVWITNYSGGGVTEIIGAAAPVVTPLSVAAGNGQLGQKP